MYRAFDVNLSGFSQLSDADSEAGQKLWNENATQVRTKLETFLRNDGSLDGSEMQKNWFPQVDADVFISHSHQDQMLAIRLAGWLSRHFSLRPFIDSCVWGNSEFLLKLIDDEYCLNPGRETYSYEKRNRSTSHVHMMLSVALTKMIDNTESAWVLNTQNSITSKDVVERTQSPWIFSEISTMRLIRRKDAESHRQQVKLAKSIAMGRRADSPIGISYMAPLDSFAKLNATTLQIWKARPRSLHALDLLYELVPEPRSAAPMTYISGIGNQGQLR